MTIPVLRHALLEERGLEHGFGTRHAGPRDDVARPVQVHGVVVARVDAGGSVEPAQADAIVTSRSRQCVGVVTADCVPILAAVESGRAVAAIHAGWRGLVAGVIERGLDALRSRLPDEALVAVVGPHIGACCYEVDEPVLGPLRARFGGEIVDDALTPTQPGHGLIDLAALVRQELSRQGVGDHRTGWVDGCTRCDADRFHSYRRDGRQAGRLLHFIAPR